MDTIVHKQPNLCVNCFLYIYRLRLSHTEKFEIISEQTITFVIIQCFHQAAK